MREEKKMKFRYFVLHQYEKEERFLEDMAAKGWFYEGGIRPPFYRFTKGKPAEMIYQLDYVTKEEDRDDYHQLFADAGWKEVDGVGSNDGKWYYFCKKRESGQEDRIFTDNDSKLELVNKLWKNYSVLLIIVLLLEANGIRSMLHDFGQYSIWSERGVVTAILVLLMLFVIGICVFCIVGLLRLRKKFTKEK